MNAVPFLFAEDVVRLFDKASLDSLKDGNISVFGTAGRLVFERDAVICLNVVYNPEASTFDYYLSDEMSIYVHQMSERFLYSVFIILLEEKGSRWPSDQWKTATSSDRVFLRLLRAPFKRCSLDLRLNCPQFLNLLPDLCTYNKIFAPDAYSDALDAIIQRSQECGRLERMDCGEFFRKRGREASIRWIATNRRLEYILYYVRGGIRRTVGERYAFTYALDQLGVQ